MQLIEIPEFPRLHGEKAIEALYDFVNEVEEQRGKELTDKQATVLIRFAWGLMSSIEAEMQLGSSDRDVEEMHFVSQLKRKVVKYVPEAFRNRENGRLWKLGK